jgi:hypothetical protein
MTPASRLGLSKLAIKSRNGLHQGVARVYQRDAPWKSVVVAATATGNMGKTAAVAFNTCIGSKLAGSKR